MNPYIIAISLTVLFVWMVVLMLANLLEWRFFYVMAIITVVFLVLLLVAMLVVLWWLAASLAGHAP